MTRYPSHDALSEQLLQADKMVALGTLVSGIGHEINNPNNFIMLNVPLLKGAWEDAFPVLDRYQETHGDLRLRGIPFAKARTMLPQLLDDVLEGARRIKRIVAVMGARANSPARSGIMMRLAETTINSLPSDCSFRTSAGSSSARPCSKISPSPRT